VSKHSDNSKDDLLANIAQLVITQLYLIIMRLILKTGGLGFFNLLFKDGGLFVFNETSLCKKFPSIHLLSFKGFIPHKQFFNYYLAFSSIMHSMFVVVGLAYQGNDIVFRA
jgi:hypothetical protein